MKVVIKSPYGHQAVAEFVRGSDDLVYMIFSRGLECHCIGESFPEIGEQIQQPIQGGVRTWEIVTELASRQ